MTDWDQQMNKNWEEKEVIEQAVTYLVPGMRIAKDVLSDDGKILVNKGTELSLYTIQRLKDWQIDKVSIMKENVETPLVAPEMQKFINTYNQSINIVEKAFDTLRQTQEVPFNLFVETNDEVQKAIPAGGSIIDQLYNLPACDDYTFYHSVNVSVIAALIARWLDYPADIVSMISLTGLLHDIGKSQLPHDILNKPNLLSALDYELYKKHVNYGFELLRNNSNIPQSIKMGVLSHHEREDGSGYPCKIGSNKIHPYAKIIAIADFYDEYLTINRDPAILLSPYAALEKLKDHVLKIEPKATITFFDRMTNFLSGNIVALTDGRIGRVVFINKVSPSRSIVQLENGQVLDLSEIPDLQVHHLV